MDEEIQDESESLNTEEVGQDTNLDETAEELAKAKEIASNQKIRAEKAEAELKALKNKPAEKETPKNNGMDLKDIRALQDVPDEDVDEVIDFAKFRGITIAEAKKNPVMQILLKTKAEERKTAEATNTATSRRSSSKVSDDELLDKFSKGELPMEDLERAAKARIERMRKGN